MNNLFSKKGKNKKNENFAVKNSKNVNSEKYDSESLEWECIDSTCCNYQIIVRTGIKAKNKKVKSKINKKKSRTSSNNKISSTDTISQEKYIAHVEQQNEDLKKQIEKLKKRLEFKSIMLTSTLANYKETSNNQGNLTPGAVQIPLSQNENLILEQQNIRLQEQLILQNKYIDQLEKKAKSKLEIKNRL